MLNVLEVQIVGDVSALEKSLNEAKKLQAEYTASIEKTSAELKENITVTNGYKKAIDDLNAAYKSGSISQKDFQKQLANLKRDEKEAGIATADLRKELANLKREQKDLGNGLQKDLTPKIANGSNALIQISRIAQDAPYGFNAIAGNVTASGEAFSYLVKQTGSVGGALKALGSSIVGSGGVLLAVSLLSSAITYLVNSGIKVEDIIDAISGSISKSRKEMQALNSEVAKNAQSQISSVNAYVSAAKNINLSMEDRIIAVKKLQSEYPGYFANLTQEQILNGDVSKAVDDVTKALKNKARAMALTDKLVDLAGKEEDIYSNLNNFVVRLAKELGLNVKETFELSKAINQLVKSGEDFSNVSTADINSLPERLKQYVLQNGVLKDMQNSLKTNLYQQDQLTKKINESTAAQLQLEKTIEPKTKEAKIKDPIIPFKTELKPELDVEKTTEALLEVKNEYGKLEEKLIKFEEPVEVPIKIRPQADPNLVKNLPKLDDIMSKYKEMTGEDLVLPDFSNASGEEIDNYVKSLERGLQAARIFSSGTSSAIGSLAGDLASSLETGNAALDAFVGSVIQGLAEVAAAQLAGLIAKQSVAAVSLGTDAAVATGNAVVAATETASATGPAAAFVLPALVGAAIGFIAAAFSGIKFAHGGIVPGGSFTGDKIPAMLNSGEAVMNQQQQANTLMAIANGNSNSLQGNRKSSTFILETKLRGADIQLALKRQEKSR